MIGNGGVALPAPPFPVSLGSVSQMQDQPTDRDANSFDAEHSFLSASAIC